MSQPVGFPPEALLILEERLRDRQWEDEWPPPDADVTGVALVLLLGAELVRESSVGGGAPVAPPRED